MSNPESGISTRDLFTVKYLLSLITLPDESTIGRESAYGTKSSEPPSEKNVGVVTGFPSVFTEERKLSSNGNQAIVSPSETDAKTVLQILHTAKNTTGICRLVRAPVRLPRRTDAVVVNFIVSHLSFGWFLPSPQDGRIIPKKGGAIQPKTIRFPTTVLLGFQQSSLEAVASEAKDFPK